MKTAISYLQEVYSSNGEITSDDFALAQQMEFGGIMSAIALSNMLRESNEDKLEPTEYISVMYAE